MRRCGASVFRISATPTASLLLQAGEPIAYVKEQLGHSSIQVTVDLYGHFVPGANRGAVERLAAATTSTAAPRDLDLTWTSAEATQRPTPRMRRKSLI